MRGKYPQPETRVSCKTFNIIFIYFFVYNTYYRSWLYWRHSGKSNILFCWNFPNFMMKTWYLNASIWILIFQQLDLSRPDGESDVWNVFLSQSSTEKDRGMNKTAVIKALKRTKWLMLRPFVPYRNDPKWHITVIGFHDLFTAWGPRRRTGNVTEKQSQSNGAVPQHGQSVGMCSASAWCLAGSWYGAEEV